MKAISPAGESEGSSHALLCLAMLRVYGDGVDFVRFYFSLDQLYEMNIYGASTFFFYLFRIALTIRSVLLSARCPFTTKSAWIIPGI